MQKQSKILAFVGDGEGKTSAAVGHAVRAAGHGKKVLIVQFLKGSENTGEYKYFYSSDQKKNISIKQFGHTSFLLKNSDRAPHKEKAVQGMTYAISEIASGEHFLVVLDEILDALNEGLISQNDMEKVLDSARASATNLVITGRILPQQISSKVDLITRLQKIKHYFDLGEKGIEGLDR